MYVSCGVSPYISIYYIYIYDTHVHIYIFCVYMSTYKYKEIHMCQIYIIYILGKMDVEKGEVHMGDGEVEEGMVGEGVGWCLKGEWNGWE